MREFLTVPLSGLETALALAIVVLAALLVGVLLYVVPAAQVSGLV